MRQISTFASLRNIGTFRNWDTKMSLHALELGVPFVDFG